MIHTESSGSWCENLERKPECKWCKGEDAVGEKLPRLLCPLPGILTGAELPKIPEIMTKPITITNFKQLYRQYHTFYYNFSTFIDN